MKLNPQIEVLGELIAPQRAFFLSATASVVRPVIQLGVVVERIWVGSICLDTATPLMSAELENQTHRLPVFQFSEN